MKGYLALVMDSYSVVDLKRYGKYETVHCHHCTVVFSCREEDHKDLIGKEVNFRGLAVVSSANIDCMILDLGKELTEISNRTPHVTLSSKVGTPPNKSNEMLAAKGEGTTRKPIIGNVPLVGTIEFIPFG